ncbi:hypothetical protein FMM80_03125 [Schaedlerella arabinosiphila]|jgi:chromosome segregation ATPase|uniref:Uncharacterized protein n=1 Tax=Schaedlerella arabinosiphila TaxID=2044587 RepID=A0A9X5C4D4_9FIRM|nr:hypothetical protein [Schaedlerella arabinosiphila]KAI4439395.1 hypothetical protein C824_001882 [Schaedlerella arabinosiphila]MCI9604748.1 hypothetical protein [Ruminococcus sp.]MCI9633384.1 hypothetical protein [Ruminococcus sp.]NDO67759.1 hypothetical protein [Schaedlerella arabinosiphila]
MTDSQKLDLILSEVIGMKGDVAVLKEDMAVLKEDVAVLKEDVAILKEDVAVLKEKVSVLEQRVDNIEQRVTGIEVHLENQTDKNIQLIAENFIELTNKLNQAIPVADKNLAYEVKVNYLIEKVQFLEKDFQEFKYQMAYS